MMRYAHNEMGFGETPATHPVALSPTHATTGLVPRSEQKVIAGTARVPTLIGAGGQESGRIAFEDLEEKLPNP